MRIFKKIGEDVLISESINILKPELVEIGNHSSIDAFFHCTTQLIIGDHVHINGHCGVIGGSEAKFTMNDFTFMSLGSKVICGTDEFIHGFGLTGCAIPEQYQDKKIIKPVVFERFSGLGANSLVMPGVILGEGSIVGANSLVIESTEPWTIYVGSPAKPLKMRPNKLIIEKARQMGYF